MKDALAIARVPMLQVDMVGKIEDGPHEQFIIGVHELNDRWTFNGDIEKPSFSPSLLVTMEDGNGKVMLRCHSFITDGKIRYLDDCTHAMAGQTIDLPDIG